MLFAAIRGAFAQAPTLRSDARLTIVPNTTLVIQGSVDNRGTLRNDGHIKVAGQWVNSGLYDAGTGHVTFNSTSPTVPQVIHHNGQAFSGVTIAGGTRKVVVSDLFIENNIFFEKGIVEAAGGAKVIFGPDIAMEGMSTASHIYGSVYQRGSGYKVFPLGNGVEYLPVEIPEVDNVEELIGVQLFEPQYPVTVQGDGLETILTPRYWYIEALSGQLPSSPIVLPLDRSRFNTDDQVVVVQAVTTDGKFVSIGRAVDEPRVAGDRVMSGSDISMPVVTLARSRSGHAQLADHGVIVHNAVSDNGDGLNDFIMIQNIERYPENRFSVFNRWGDKVFEVQDYDNQHRVFRGRSNINREAVLPSGQYFYVLTLPDQQPLRGFIVVRQ